MVKRKLHGVPNCFSAKHSDGTPQLQYVISQGKQNPNYLK